MKNRGLLSWVLEFAGRKKAYFGGSVILAIASAFAAGASLLLFDETTSGLDYSHMEKVGALLRELTNRGKTVLVSTHDSELIETCCDYTLYIEKGRTISLEKV